MCVYKIVWRDEVLLLRTKHLDASNNVIEQHLDASNNIIDAHTHLHTYAYKYTYICIYTYVHILQRMCCRCVRWCQRNICITHTAAYALVPRTPVLKCTQHPLQKNAHTYIHTHICIRIHMHKNIHAHLWHCSNTHIHAGVYPFMYKCRYIHICMFIHTHAYTNIRTHIHHVHLHTRKHAWNDSAAATVRGADTDAGSSTRLFRSTQSTTFSTSNARTSLYPLPETPIILNPPFHLPNIPQNSLQTASSAVLLFHTDQHNRLHKSEEVPHSFTMPLCVVVQTLEGKQRCSRAPVGDHAGHRAREWRKWPTIWIWLFALRN